jgi:hypothetical protein
MADTKVTEINAEVAFTADADPEVRVTQVNAEVAYTAAASPEMRVTEICVEVLMSVPAHLKGLGAITTVVT